MDTQMLAAFVRCALDEHGDLVYVPQENVDLAFMLWGRPFAQRSHPDLPRHEHHRFFTEDRARFFVDERTWREYLTGFDFAVGNRIHGTIAAILAGVPSVVIPFDSRIAELAEVHALTTVSFIELEGRSCAELAEQVDADRFNATHEDNLKRYAAFLDRHDLRMPSPRARPRASLSA